VVEQQAAGAAQLDDDGEMRAWTFAAHPARLPDLRVAELPEWPDLHARVARRLSLSSTRPGCRHDAPGLSSWDEPSPSAAMSQGPAHRGDLRGGAPFQ
jgi:hypothetical protein